MVEYDAYIEEKHMIRWKTSLCILLAILFCLAPTRGNAATRMEASKRLEDFRQFFIDFQSAPDRAVPDELLAECYGVIIMTQFRAGFIFGGEFGGGVVLLHNRNTGEWSPPAFIRSAGGSWGLQVGGQQTDAIVLIMNQDGVNMLLKSRFSIGIDAAAAAGPVGRNVAAAVGPGTALLTYSRARGLFAGATLGGEAMLNNNEMNTALYGRPVTVRDIIEGRISMPSEAYSLVNTLRAATKTSNTSRQPAYQQQPQPNLYPLQDYPRDQQETLSPGPYQNNVGAGAPQFTDPPMQPLQGRYPEPAQPNQGGYGYYPEQYAEPNPNVPYDAGFQQSAPAYAPSDEYYDPYAEPYTANPVQ